MTKFTLTCLVASLFLSLSSQTPCEDGMAGEWPCDNIDLWMFMPLADIGGGDRTNDIWGWTDELSGREFALVGKDVGTAFVEITDPSAPVYLGTLPASTDPSTWRDIKVYNNRAYIVSEASDHGMQVFDLPALLNVDMPPVEFSALFVYDGFGDAHNIVINEESGFAYGVGANTFSGGLHILDIEVDTPEDIFLAGSYEESGYTHDAHIVNYIGPDQDFGGKEIAFCCNGNEVVIVDVTTKSDCQLIAAVTYQNSGYTHQGWLTEDHKHFLFNDELDEINFYQNTRTHVLDVQDLANPEYLGFYEHDNTSIDHNLYVVGDLAFQSNYRSGVRILDVAQVADVNFALLGYFDVTPDNDDAAFSGSWSNYAWFKSGTVICSDMLDGFFVLKPTIFEFDPPAVEIDCGADSQEFTANINAEIDGTFLIQQEGLPASVQIITTAFEAPGETIVTLSNLSSLETGYHEFQFIFMSEFGSYPVWSSITVVGEVPGVPELTSPNDQADLDFSQPSFDWSDASGATEYHFELSEFNDFSSVLIDEITATSEYDVPFDLLPGTYYWRVSATNACGESELSVVFGFTILDTGIESFDKPSMTIYPNPAVDQISIDYSGEASVIVIADPMGRIVYQNRLNQAGLTVEIGNWASGLYTIRLDDGTSSVFEKK